MTSITKDSSLLAKLASTLAGHRYTLAGLLGRLSGFGSTTGMKSSVFSKFLRTLEQISIEKEKESDLISRIQMIEERHRHQRKSKKLRCATNRKSKAKNHSIKPIQYEPECEPSGFSWAPILAYLYMRSGNTPKLHD